MKHRHNTPYYSALDYVNNIAVVRPLLINIECRKCERDSSGTPQRLWSEEYKRIARPLGLALKKNIYPYNYLLETYHTMNSSILNTLNNINCIRHIM